MATEVSRYSQTQLQNRAQKHQMPKMGKWYWSNGHTRAYNHDSQVPRRSYNCSFCHREFRSAQALGGHMNVHRRERAMLHQSHHSPDLTSSCSNNVYSAPEFIASKRVQLFNSVQLASNLPSTILSSAVDHGNAALNLFPGETEIIRGEGDVRDCVNTFANYNDWSTGRIVVDELDLELRLG